MYSFKSKVRYSECDENLKIKITSLVDYMQDCVTFQSEEVNNGPRLGRKLNIGWILSTWQIRIDRYPKLGEEIKISTWPYKFKGFFAFRNFVVYDEKENVVACADSKWVYLDVEHNELLRIPKEVQELYPMHSNYPTEISQSKIRIPDNVELKQNFKIPKFFIDSNKHVNNEKYILMGLEYIPEHKTVKSIKVEFKKAALLGDEIFLCVSVDENGLYTILLRDGQDKSYANLVFELL